MSAYWKSQPKKHCDFCKCWIADNRASIDFHERGKRHKENVEKKLTELRKKGQEQYKMQQTLDSDLIRMETAALKAFKKDLENDPALAAQYRAQAAANAASAATAAKSKEELLNSARKLHKQGLVSTKQAGKATTKGSTPSTAPATETPSHTSGTTAAEGSKTTPPTDATPTTEATPTPTTEETPTCAWLEGTSPEGHTYYWNTVTGESLWEKPEDYVATEESTMYKQQEQEEQEPREETTNTSQDLKPPGIRDEEPEENNEGEEKEDDSGDEEDNEEDDEDEERNEDEPRPVKRKMANPYGGWSTIIPDNTPPVDLQLPQPDRPSFQPIIPKAAQHQPRKKVKFKERTVSSLTSASQSSSSPLGGGGTSFKKRKFGGGGRSIRQRDTDT